jgi:hypothetical protein
MLAWRNNMSTVLQVCELLVASAVAVASLAKAADVRVTVDTAAVLSTMRGGIGASWHAIETPITTEAHDPVFKGHQHGGSGWGGNPPAEDAAAWQQIYRHAAWLGMDFVRVELEQRMYEPEKGKFDWDNPEMRILYRILDHCQQNQVDVFLTQMWANVAWNAFPEFCDRPAGIVHSGPRSIDDFATGLATCVDHLVHKKGYTCIKWLCITNEPHGWWWRPPREAMPLRPGLEAVRKALDERKIAVQLSAPDAVGVPECKPEAFDYHDLVGAYDFHSYFVPMDRDANNRPMESQHRKLADWAKWVHANHKALFLSEIGQDVYDGDHPGPSTFEAAVHNTEMVVRHLNAGVDGFNRWSFNNRGDLDGQFQMIETWDRKNKRLLKEFTPKPNSYFTYGLLSRFTAKHSEVLSCRVEGGRTEELPRVFAAALRSPRGNLTLALLNDAPRQWTVEIDIRGLAGTKRLYRYVVSAADRDNALLRIEPASDVALTKGTSTILGTIPPASLTIYSTYHLAHAEPGVTGE